MRTKYFPPRPLLILPCLSPLQGLCTPKQPLQVGGQAEAEEILILQSRYLDINDKVTGLPFHFSWVTSKNDSRITSQHSSILKQKT